MIGNSQNVFLKGNIIFLNVDFTGRLMANFSFSPVPSTSICRHRHLKAIFLHLFAPSPDLTFSKGITKNSFVIITNCLGFVTLNVLNCLGFVTSFLMMACMGLSQYFIYDYSPVFKQIVNGVFFKTLLFQRQFIFFPPGYPIHHNYDFALIVKFL